MLGVLRGVHGKIVLSIGAVFMNGMMASTLQCFVYRHHVLLKPGSKLRFSKGRYIRFALYHYLSPTIWFLCGSLTAPLEAGPDSEILRKTIREDSSLAYMASLNSFYIMDRRALYPPYLEVSSGMLMATAILAVIVYGVIVTGLIVWHCFALLNDQHSLMSTRTKQIHRRFLHVLLIGVTIPIATMGLPYIGVLIMVLIRIRFPQWLTNLLVGTQAAHTTLTSFVLLSATPSYRRYIIGMVSGFFGRPPQRDKSRHARLSIVVPARSEYGFE
ncbi:unnamed protein product, partial [Mesorhabditis spiculigera]